MKRRSTLAVLAFTVFAAACSSDDGKPSAAAPTAAAPATDAASADEARPAKVPILEGYKYYVGGPVMGKDAYGRYRISDFQGEVQQPPSRGMVFGVKRDGDRMEYRVWGNGKLLAVHKGLMRDRIFWQDYVEGYRDEKLVAREYHTHNDAETRTTIKTEDFDPKTGESIRIREYSVSYHPPVIPSELDDDLDADLDDEDDVDEAAPAVPSPTPTPAPERAAE
jgi:hypothetical protein